MEESRTLGQGRRLAARWQGLIACLASVFLYVIAFPPFNLPEAAYVFALPVLLSSLFARPTRLESPILFLGGWLAWLVLVFWLRNVTNHIEGAMGRVLGWAALIGLSGIMAVFWWVWFRIAVWVMRLAGQRALAARLAALVGLASLWVVIEWIREHLFTGFPWLTLSISQWERPLLLQISSVTGASGISFVLIGFNVGLAFYLHNLWLNRKATWWRSLSLEFYLALVFLFGAIGYGLHSSGAGRHGQLPGPRLAFVQPNAGAVEKWDPALVRENLQVLEDLTTYAGFLGAELVLWPEAPTPMPVKGNASMQHWVEGVSRETGLPLLIGNIAREGAADAHDRRWYNAVFLVDPINGVDTENYYAKRHLVPFGEYVPFADWIPFLRKIVPVPGDFYPGESARPIQAGNSVSTAGRVGVLICYEDVFPQLARENTLAGADWHFVATNNAWFGEEAAAWQHAAHSVLRAVETRRPVVRCGNAGWSGWIDEFGHIRHVMLSKENSVYFQGVEVVELTRNAWWSIRLSPYVKYGSWFNGLCLLLVVLCYGLIRISPARSLQPKASRSKMVGL